MATAFSSPVMRAIKPCSGAPITRFLLPWTKIIFPGCRGNNQTLQLWWVPPITSITGDADGYNKSLVGGQVGFSYLLGQGLLVQTGN